MFSNFEPLRGLEPRTHALRMRNRVLKISELDGMRKNLYRNKTKKIKRQKIKKDKKISYYIYFSDWDFGGRCLLGLGWRGWSADRDDADWAVREERRLLRSSLSLVSWAIWSRRVWMMESR